MSLNAGEQYDLSRTITCKAGLLFRNRVSLHGNGVNMCVWPSSLSQDPRHLEKQTNVNVDESGPDYRDDDTYVKWSSV